MTNVLDTMNSLIETAIETQDVDMTETGTGGGAFDKRILPKGSYYGRVIEYVEYGKVLPLNNGKPTGKPAVLNARFAFQLYDSEGSVIIRPFPFGVYNNEKARFKHLFDRLNAKGDLRHPAQALGRAYVFEVDVAKSKKSGADYNTINYATVAPLPPFDPNTGKPVALPELDVELLKVFLWNNPTQATWDSLYIDGVNDKGESKNFIQNDILKAVDYEGSKLQALLEGSVPSPESMLPAAPAETPAEEAAPATPAPAAPAAPSAPAAPTAPAAPATPAV